MKQHATRKTWTLAALMAAAIGMGASAPSVHAEVITGSVSNWAGWDSGRSPTDSLLVFGDGTHHVSAAWTFATYDQDWDPESPRFSAWFYAMHSSLVAPQDSVEVAWAPGVTEIAEITDASIFAFTSTDYFLAHEHKFADAQSNDGLPGSSHGDGVGDFIVLRNASSGHYGVLRVDAVHSLAFEDDGRVYAHMDATWWFQTDGTGDFSTVPTPGTLLIGLFAAAPMIGRRRR